MNDAESKNSLLKLAEMRTLKTERDRIQKLIQEGTASREDKQVFENSKNFEKDFEALRKKDSAVQLTRESLRDKLDKASARLRDLSLKSLGITHIFKVKRARSPKITQIIGTAPVLSRIWRHELPGPNGQRR